MLRLVLPLALTLGAPAFARAQGDGDFQIIRDWDADRSKTESVQDTLRLIDGMIWTPRAYADFVFRFEYRPAAPGGSATLLLRTSVDGNRNIRSYEVALDRTPERGRLAGVRQVLHEGPFKTSAAVGDATTWIAGEVRAESDRLRVMLDGTTVSTADRAEALFGTIGFKAGGGGVELRGMRVAVLSSQPTAIGVGLPRASDPGITKPKATRRAYPSYTRAAMTARAQGVAQLEFVIEADGSIGPVRVIDAPHPDLALSSVACLRQWRFTPAKKDGQPVAVVATMDLAFNLK